VTPRFSLFVARRAAVAILLVLAAASAAHLLAGLAPGDHLSEFEMTPEQLQAERHRSGRDRPLHERYADWLQHAVRLDLGESARYPGRTVWSLITERIGNSVRLGGLALLLATLLGIPLGVLAGSGRRRPQLVAARAVNIVLLSLPPVVLSLGLLFVAARTGWFPVGGLPPGGGVDSLRYFVLPVLALGLPVAASLERLQSRSMAQALRHPSLLAARARGIPERRLVWGHAFKLSLTPVLAIYGVVIGAMISGSFVVEYVMTWPGLGRLMYDGLIARDANVVAGCAAAGAAWLAVGVFVSDVLMAAVDPRRGDLT
jgi:ABC-type dipeptide/oligopeptide/nickel transport system permease component